MTRLSAALLSLFVILAAPALSHAADPTSTTYSWDDCQGTFKPYPAPTELRQLPDTLKPVMLNHVGRHGSRFPASSRAATALRGFLAKIDDNGGLSDNGKQLLTLTDKVIETASGRWGSLSQLGMAQERGIASRMFSYCRPLFSSGRVNAISSYSPRCIMSMYEFVHQLSRLDNNINVTTTSGRCNSPMMRFFDNSPLFTSFLESDELAGVERSFTASMMTTAPLTRLARQADLQQLFSDEELQQAVTNMFTMLTGLQAFGMTCKASIFFTPQEQNQLWAIANMRHYLRRSDSVLSAVPADIAAPLLDDIIKTFDTFIADSAAIAPVQLRFGHAETLMPLLALLRLPGCYYLTNYFDTVALHWKDFYVAPMAANVQFILLRSKKGRLYLRTLLNEVPVPLIPGSKTIDIPWPQAREQLLKSLPFDFGL